jgi:hypothetical protein
MIEWLMVFYEYHTMQIWLIGVGAAALGLIFWSLIASFDRHGPRGPYNR